MLYGDNSPTVGEKDWGGSIRLTGCLVENITNWSAVRRNWESVLHTFAFFSLIKSQAGLFACLY